MAVNFQRACMSESIWYLRRLLPRPFLRYTLRRCQESMQISCAENGELAPSVAMLVPFKT